MLGRGELLALQRGGRGACDERSLDYVVRLMRATRDEPAAQAGRLAALGAGAARGGQGARALEGRDFVTPDDVKAVAVSVLNHRLMLKAEAEVEGVTADDVMRQTLEQVQVPR